MRSVSIFLRVLSYVYPIRFRRSTGVNNTKLELALFRNQWQLSTHDAIYSEGTSYRPLAVAFKTLKTELNKVKSVLVLGTGLGSAVMILNKHNHTPDITLVDYDETSLGWALELFDENTTKRIEPVCEDAREFVKKNTHKYDLLIIDIFEGRVVPDFVTEDWFLNECRQSVNPGGNIVINYIENAPNDWERVKEKISKILPLNNIITFGVNYVMLATV